ncbi:MAG TPA: Iron-sulfur cluster carrier protein [Hyphomicrobiaceae bacterium MAG_BT-2024]
MAYFLAIANRKGGVGKSTVSVMLTYAFALWSNKKVLLIDLDAQSNSSLILMGGERWIKAQRTSKNVAAYIEDRLYSIEQTKIYNYIEYEVGDIEVSPGNLPDISILPGSLNFEDLQDELITYYSRNQTPFRQAKTKCSEHFRAALSFANSFSDIVILDCAPGISNATAAALKLANKIIVPFRPDAVSQFAVDRISRIIEGGKKFEEVLSIPANRRRYVCLANYVRKNRRDGLYIDNIAVDHPILKSFIPAMPAVSDAFDFLGEPQNMEEKYGEALRPLRALHQELLAVLPF